MKNKHHVIVETQRLKYEFDIKRNITVIQGDSATGKHIVVIADGAAFGAYVAKVTAIAKSRKDVLMYFPESFEWLILKSGIIGIKDLDDILAEPEKYIESREFFSWERYFTDLLITATADDNIKKYEKSQLKSYYLEGKNKDAIIDVLPEKIRNVCSFTKE